MPKTYSELEAWGIFVGAIIIAVVLTSLFWGFITVPEEAKKIEKEIANSSADNPDFIIMSRPDDFVSFCKKVDGVPAWDNSGFRQCTVNEYSDKRIILMNMLCRKFNLSLSYGSFGVKCERRVQ